MCEFDNFSRVAQAAHLKNSYPPIDLGGYFPNRNHPKSADLATIGNSSEKVACLHDPNRY